MFIKTKKCLLKFEKKWEIYDLYANQQNID